MKTRLYLTVCLPVAGFVVETRTYHFHSLKYCFKKTVRSAPITPDTTLGLSIGCVKNPDNRERLFKVLKSELKNNGTEAHVTLDYPDYVDRQKLFYDLVEDNRWELETIIPDIEYARVIKKLVETKAIIAQKYIRACKRIGETAS